MKLAAAVDIYVLHRRAMGQKCEGRRTDSSSRQPRLHDLRHTFAVHRLTEWYKTGTDVQKLLPALSTYLGHVNLHSTQCYLTNDSGVAERG